MNVPIQSRFTVCVVTAAIALLLASGPGYGAERNKRSAVQLPTLGVGDMADAMNPMNPFNGGVEPIAMPGDARLVVFTYNRDQIYRVLTAPLKLTTIEFDDDEQIVGEPGWGDSVRWEYESDGANRISLKPHAPGLVNTLTVKTNKRSYEFTLVSSPLGGIFYQKVRFRVPKTLAEKRAARGAESGTSDAMADQRSGAGAADVAVVSPDRLNFDYSIEGNQAFKPETVFDDGKAIWLRIPKTADWPIALYKDGSDWVVANFIRRGDFLVVQRIANEVMLRSGDAEVKVTRGKQRFLGLF